MEPAIRSLTHNVTPPPTATTKVIAFVVRTWGGRDRRRCGHIPSDDVRTQAEGPEAVAASATFLVLQEMDAP